MMMTPLPAATALASNPIRVARRPIAIVSVVAALLAAASLPALAQRGTTAGTPLGPSTAHPQASPAASPDATAGDRCPIPPHGQSLPAVGQLRDFHRTSEFVLFVEGNPQPYELYQSERAGAGLLVSPAFRSAWVFSAGALAAIDTAKLERRPDGIVDVRADAALGSPGTFHADDKNELTFTVEGRKAVLKPQTPLLGLRRIDEVTAHNPEYVLSASHYQTDPRAIAALRKEQRPVTVRVYYGSWCSHCRKLVPNGLKVEEALRSSKIRFEYFGVRSPKEVPQGARTDPPEIPTAVVFVGGAGVGRIVGDRAWQALEVSLRDLLAESSSSRR